MMENQKKNLIIWEQFFWKQYFEPWNYFKILTGETQRQKSSSILSKLHSQKNYDQKNLMNNKKKFFSHSFHAFYLCQFSAFWVAILSEKQVTVEFHGSITNRLGRWLCFLGHPIKDAPVLKRNVGCAQGRQKRKRRAIITHCKSTKWRRLLLCSVLLPKSSDKVLRWALFMEQNLWFGLVGSF